MVGRDMVLKTKLVEQALLHLETPPRMPHQGIPIRRKSPGVFRRDRHIADLSIRREREPPRVAKSMWPFCPSDPIVTSGLHHHARPCLAPMPNADDRCG